MPLPTATAVWLKPRAKPDTKSEKHQPSPTQPKLPSSAPASALWHTSLVTMPPTPKPQSPAHRRATQTTLQTKVPHSADRSTQQPTSRASQTRQTAPTTLQRSSQRKGATNTKPALGASLGRRNPRSPVWPTQPYSPQAPPSSPPHSCCAQQMSRQY